jgi:truncated hemoglobin YjbI
METGDKRSLYDRVGGYDVVAAMIDDLLTRVRADSQIGGC